MGNVTFNAELFCPSERVLFQTQAAALAWAASLNVADADGDTPGAVGQATMPPTISTTVTPTYLVVNVMNGDGSTTAYTVPSQTDYDNLLALVNELKTNYNSLRAAMIAAGQGV